MDITKENINPHPRDKANPLSILCFTYTYDMFKKGYNKTLDVDDLYSPLKSDKSEVLGDRLERKWKNNLEKTKLRDQTPSLLRVLIATFWPEYLWMGALLGTATLVFELFQPILLGCLLDYFRTGSNVSKEDALWYAGALTALNALSAVFINHYMMCATHYGMKVRAACCALIYRKSLKLSKTALGDTASGKIVNLLSNDVSRFDIVSIFIHQMWVAPTSAIIVMYLMYREASYASFIGVVPVFLVVPLQAWTGKLSARYRKQTALKTDERVRLMDEIISGVQVIKMYAWEKPFAKLIKFARRSELKIVMKSSYVRALFMTFNLFTTRLALFCTLITVALTDRSSLTASKVFVFMSYYNIISQTMSTMFVRGISEVAELLVAIKRLETFLTSEEYTSSSIHQNNHNCHAESEKYAISMKNVTAKWNIASSDSALQTINLNVPRGKLIGIIGPVGSGKSSILQTILGELNIVDGSLAVNDSVSYAAQEPWVFAATVRQNIIFGSEYDKKRYSEVVRACALEKDFKQFPDGDLTIVGDRGASLSGGQKARISLARAVYRQANIYLLDDPLSAVDIHVSKHLFDLCINGYLKDSTRILVTHQVHHLRDADHIIILKNGSIEAEGTFTDLSTSDNLYAKLLSSEPDAEDELRQKHVENAKARKMSIRSMRSSLVSSVSELSIPGSILSENLDQDDSDEEVEKINIKDMQEESSKGKVRGSLLLKYLLAGGSCGVVLMVFLLFALAQMSATAVDYFVSLWVTIEERRNLGDALNTSTEVLVTEYTSYFQEWSTETCLYVYGGLIITLWCFALSRSVLFYKLAMRSSQQLHNTIFSGVIMAPMRFFDTNPSGRILNRFSKDIGAIDELLPKVLLDSGQILLTMVGSLVLVTIVNPYFLILVAILGIVFSFMRYVFLKSSKNIKRLEGIMRSPVFTHLNATIQGLTTIRAYGAEDVLKREFDKHQDAHTSAWFMYVSASAALGFHLDGLCLIFIGLITFSFLTFGEDFGLTGGQVGLAITQAIALTGLVQYGMRQSAEVANQLMSVERVLEYKDLPSEMQPKKPVLPPKTWPDKGQIIFEDMGLKYDQNGPLVLKHLNVHIKPREKVGIVGRTGAGKSSLISALFRLAFVEGKIQIDDIDTKDLKLETLRSKISIIPQDPVLFSGTLRYNLDPFNEHTDEMLYRAINEVELKDPANIINRLENRVNDKGSNYSVGQRQLICLARAIVRNNKILMLDEATANVDPQTDALIQKTIRRKFADCTVLTVAHRLNTIMDSDKVLVMDAGTMVEFDHPYNLLQDSEGIFCKMVAEAGRATADVLRRTAKESFMRQKSLVEEHQDATR